MIDGEPQTGDHEYEGQLNEHVQAVKSGFDSRHEYYNKKSSIKITTAVVTLKNLGASAFNAKCHHN